MGHVENETITFGKEVDHVIDVSVPPACRTRDNLLLLGFVYVETDVVAYSHQC